MSVQRLIKAYLAAVLLGAGIASTSIAAIYVDADATGANNGTSWADAYVSLVAALDEEGAEEIRVAQGVYRPAGAGGNRGASFSLSSGRVLRGGYAGFGEPNPDARDFAEYETILSGDLNGNDAPGTDAANLAEEPRRSDNSEHIIKIGQYQQGTSICTIEGFTISGARTEYSGGGLMVDYSDAVVKDCIFADNSAEFSGGAMAFWNSRVIFKRCSFIRNAADENGGAVFTDGCDTCRGSYLLLENCVFLDNYAGIFGGAVSNHSTAVTSLVNCLIAGNYAAGSGGGIYDNGHYGCRLTNCTLVGNAESAVTLARRKSVMTNCIVWDNRFGTNTNEASQISVNGDAPAVNYCLIQNWTGSLGGQGNFTAEPLFVSAGYWDGQLKWVDGDYHLSEDSPCVDTGDPQYVAKASPEGVPGGYYLDDYEELFVESSVTDLDGRGRVAGGRVDIGADEQSAAELVAHWRLDEAEGETADDSAGDNDGILHGDPTWEPGGGRAGGALSFDGLGDYVNCGSSPVFDVTGEITVAAWVNIRSVNMDWQTVISKGDSAWRLSTANNEMRYHFAVRGGAPWNYINGDRQVGAGEWHHVCGTYDGVNLRLYIDGVEDPVGPVPEPDGMTVDEYDVLIGENQERAERYWDGMIDDVRIYNYALSAGQVARLAEPEAAVLYVDAGAAGRNNGSSWADAYKYLQDALSDANSLAKPVEIRVAQGIYRPDESTAAPDGTGDREAAFELISGVSLKGGYAGAGQANPDARDFEAYQTVLSGDLNGNDAAGVEAAELLYKSSRQENSYNLLRGSGTDATAVLDGVVVSGGQAYPEDIQYLNPYCYGGGLYIMGGSPSVRNCRFIANTALAFGGGIHMDGSSAPVLTDCVFSGNSATDGGGLNSDNSSPRIVGCTFTTNAACSYNADGGSGGGLYNYKSGSIIMNCTFAGNTSDEWGGAGGLRNKESNVVIANCTFTDNWGGSGGGLVNSWSEMVLANCTFVGNSTLGQGGAIVNGGQGQADVRNCILWGNSPNEIAGESPQVSWSNVQGGWAGAGNITVEPGFADPAAGDYHLKSQAGRWEPKSQSWVTDETTSPCIDAGDPMSLIGYEAFPNGGVVNMGAYGGTGEASKSYFGKPVCEKIAAGDINGDCKVNFGDFAIMALHWLEDNNQ